ncbi:UNVERIFIED_CONTAM: SNF2 domain-containing protein CLASSY 1, partial [Sesamum indicum]
FEAFWGGSWQPVERLKIGDGAISTLIVENGVVIEEDIPMSHLRIRSRKAMSFDCTSFLRPGVDVCVLTTSQNSENTHDERNAAPVWIDAKLRSIERKPHDVACDCNFYVSFYLEQGPDLILANKKLSKEMSMIKIDQISVLQRLELKPCDSEHYRWSCSEDCSSVQKFKLFTGKFCADLTWLIVTSVLRKAAFDIRSIRNHIVYEVSEYNPHVAQADPCNHTYTVNFKVENEVSTPFIVQFALDALQEGPEGREVGFLSSFDPMELRRSKRRNVQPERYLGCDNLPDYEIEVTRLGESKTYKLEYDEISSESDGYDEMPLALSVQADNQYQQYGGAEDWIRSYRKNNSGCNLESGVLKRKSHKKSSSSKHKKKSGAMDKGPQGNELAIVPANTSAENISDFFDKKFRNVKIPDDYSEDIGDMVSKYFYMNASPSSSKKKTFDFDFMEVESGSRRRQKGTRRKYHRTSSLSASLKRDCVYIRESIYDVRSFRKGSVTAQLCRELIRRCMNNIDATLKNEPIQPPVVDQWKEFQSTTSSNRREQDEKSTVNNEDEISEIDMLWKEMELALASWYLFDDNEDSHVQPTAEVPKPREIVENKCEHDFRLNEQVGTICRLCGFVETEIKDMLPPFTASAHSILNKEQRTEDEPELKKSEDGELDEFCIPAPSSTPSTIGEGQNNVWALIPDLKDKLRSHQKRAFEFLWRNIAGSLIPSRMEKKKKRRGGCVISHSPGAGKTLLIIAFLVSYLKLFPGSRPLVLAPKTTLYTWYKEIIKWKVPIPVYQIHGGQTYKGEVLKQRMKLAPGLPRNQDVMHVLDCLEKMQRWLSHPSILLMGYTSFLTLTREDSHYAHRKYMAQLLKQCPGILILDEGHNPRSTKSRLRKALMKVNTRLRVLLSGTLFQNNFGEYFNTLCLARPVFVNEVLKELDPKYEKRNKERQTQFSLENRGRKLLIDKISKKIDSNKGEERAQALKTLKKLTSKFIDVYEGGTSDKLPGLQCYTLMMKSTSLQQEILLKLQNQRPVYKGFPLELELLITLGAIHPWLIRTTACSSQYFTPEELEGLEQFKFDMKSGSKVRFVMNLIPRCLIRNEKVLIFCHNIAPINLFLQIFERFYGWRKGREVLVLQGDIELFERGRVMDKFEEPGGPSKVMLASITACAEGISLTAASRVILLDSEWNPSKSKQAIARAFRPGQNKVVYVYQLLATGTLEEEKHSRTTWKEWVSDMIFSDEHVEDPSHWQAPKIEDELLREIVEEDRAALFHRIMKNEKASNVIRGKGMLKNMRDK